MVQIYRRLLWKPLFSLLPRRLSRWLSGFRPGRRSPTSSKLHIEQLERRDVLAPIIAGGAVVVAARGYAFDGDVGAFDRGSHTLGNMSAMIQWGDGTSSPGTIDLGSSSTYVRIFGQHTYLHAGIYAMAIRVEDPTSTDTLGFGGGMAMVLAPTSHSGFEYATSVTTSGSYQYLSGGGAFGGSDIYNLGTPAGGLSFDYTLSETVKDLNGTRELVRTGYGVVDMSVWGTDFSTPDSAITITANEAEGTVFHNGTPFQIGDGVQNGTRTYTFVETSSGANYTWNRTENATKTRVGEQNTITDGHLAKNSSETSASVGGGTIDFIGDVYTESWSGSRASSYSIGAVFDQAHGLFVNQTHSSSGTYSGDEDGTISSRTYTRHEAENGSYSTSIQHSLFSSTEAGTGSYSYSLAASGTDQGSASFTSYHTDTYSGGGTVTRMGIDSPFTKSHTRIDTITTRGSEGSGGYTMTTVHSDAETSTETTTRASTQTATGGAVGIHTLSDGTLLTHGALSTATQTGNVTTGGYSLHATGSSSDTQTTTHGDRLTVSTTSGPIATASSSTTSRSTTGRSETSDRTGNAWAGTYLLTETWSSGRSGTETLADSSSKFPGDGETLTESRLSTYTVSSTSSGTATHTFNLASGYYSEHWADAATDTVNQGGTSSTSLIKADGATGGATGSESGSNTRTTTHTADREGNFLYLYSGAYSLHEVTGVNELASNSRGSTASDTESIGSVSRDTATNAVNETRSSTRTLDQTGTSSFGLYSFTISGTQASTRTVVATSDPTETMSDGSTGDGIRRTTVTTVVSGNTAGNGNGEVPAGLYILHETTTLTSSRTTRETGSEEGDYADGSSDDDSATTTVTSGGTQTITSDSTSNEIEGWSYRYRTSTWTGTSNTTSSHDEEQDGADGSDGDGDGTGYGSASETNTSTTSEYSDLLSGSYSYGESSTGSGGGTLGGTGSGSQRTGSNSTLTNNQSHSQTPSGSQNRYVSESGNRVNGDYTQSETANRWSTVTEQPSSSEIHDWATGDDGTETEQRTGTTWMSSTHTGSESGNRFTQYRTEHLVDSATTTVVNVTTSGGTDDGADGSDANDGRTATVTTTNSSSATIDRTESGTTGDYSYHTVGGQSGGRQENSTERGYYFSPSGSITTYTLTGTNGSSGYSGYTTDWSGNRATGSYSRHETSSSGSSSSATTTETSTEWTADGSTLTGILSNTSYYVEGNSATADTTGNTSSGSYSEHSENTSSWSDTASSSDSRTRDLVNGDDFTDVYTLSRSEFQNETSTADATGNNGSGAYDRLTENMSSWSAFETSNNTYTRDYANGDYATGGTDRTGSEYETTDSTRHAVGNSSTRTQSLHETSSTNASDFGNWTDTNDVDHTDGSSSYGTQTQSSSNYGLSTSTQDRESNATGSYSEYVVSTSTDTAFNTSSDTHTSIGADTSTVTRFADSLGSHYQTSNSTVDREGNSSSQTYLVHSTGGSNSSAFEFSTDTVTVNAADGSSSIRHSLDYSSHYQLSGSTQDSNGDATGYYTRLAVSTSTSSDFNVWGGDRTEYLANGGTVTSVNSGLSSHYETADSTNDAEGNSALKTGSEHAESSSTWSDFEVSTDTASDDYADGSTRTSVKTADYSYYVTDASTRDSEWNAAGSYSQSASANSLSTEFEGTTDTSTYTYANGSVKTATITNEGSHYDSSTSTDDVEGNRELSTWSQHHESSSTASDYEGYTNADAHTLADGSTKSGVFTELSTLYQTSGSISDDEEDELWNYLGHTQTNSDSTEYSGWTNTSTETFVNGSTVTSAMTQEGTWYALSDSTIDVEGNSAFGDSTLDRIDNTTSSNFEGWTDTTTGNYADGSTVTNTDHDLSSLYQTSGFTLHSEGDDTGFYTKHEVSNSTVTQFHGSTESTTQDFADGSHRTTTEIDGDQSTNTSTSTHDILGNDALGDYTITDSSTNSGTTTDGVTTSVVYTAANGSTQNDNTTVTTTVTSNDIWSALAHGNSSSGLYTENESSGGTVTTVEDTSGNSSFSSTLGWTDTDPLTRHRSVVNVTSASNTNTGNRSLGGFTLTNSFGSTWTEIATGTADGHDTTSTSTHTATTSYTRTGNESLGDYTLTTTNTDSIVSALHGTDGRGTFTGTSTEDRDTTSTESGNESTGTHSLQETSTYDSTATTSGGNTTNTYERTATASGTSTLIVTSDSSTGESTRSWAEALDTTIDETGASSLLSPAITYTLTDTISQTVHDYTVANEFGGYFIATHHKDVDETLHQTGTDGAGGGYTLDKVTTEYDYQAQDNNTRTGQYYWFGTSGSTSTAVENSTAASLTASFTEILTNDGSSTEWGNDRTGVYSKIEAGFDTADFFDEGWKGGTPFEVDEWSTMTYSSTREGNHTTGEYLLSEADSTTYDFAQTVSGYAVLSTNGTDAMSVTESGDERTGAYTRYEAGTDVFGMGFLVSLYGTTDWSSGGGSEDYSANESGNHIAQTYTKTQAGGGSESLSGAYTASTYHYLSSEEGGDTIAGGFSFSQSGTDRYAIAPLFLDVSNTQPGTQPGNVTYHTHGLPFRDPSLTEEERKRAAGMSASLKRQMAGMQALSSFDPASKTRRIIGKDQTPLEIRSQLNEEMMGAALVIGALKEFGGDTSKLEVQEKRLTYLFDEFLKLSNDQLVRFGAELQAELRTIVTSVDQERRTLLSKLSKNVTQLYDGNKEILDQYDSEEAELKNRLAAAQRHNASAPGGAKMQADRNVISVSGKIYWNENGAIRTWSEDGDRTRYASAAELNSIKADRLAKSGGSITRVMQPGGIFDEVLMPMASLGMAGFNEGAASNKAFYSYAKQLQIVPPEGHIVDKIYGIDAPKSPLAEPIPSTANPGRTQPYFDSRTASPSPGANAGGSVGRSINIPDNGVTVTLKIKASNYTLAERQLIEAAIDGTNARIAIGAEKSVAGEKVPFSSYQSRRYVRDTLFPDKPVSEVTVGDASKKLGYSVNVDEIVPRQIGGRQVNENQRFLPESINKALGPIEERALRDLPKGTQILAFKIQWTGE